MRTERSEVVPALLIAAICITGMAIAFFKDEPVVMSLLGVSAVFSLAGLLR